MIANEIYDLSARAKFPGTCFQSPLLIMSKIVAEIQFVYWKMKNNFSELVFFVFFTSDNNWFGGNNTSGIKQDWLLRL